MPAAALPANLLAQLGPMARGKDGAAPPMLVTLGDSVKFDGAFPGEKGNWSKWDQGVEALVRRQKSEGGTILYEVWKEPDNGRPFRDRLDFFSAYIHTVRKIRKFAPDTVVIGPSTQKFDFGWICEFLKVSKEYDVLPPILCWHEDGLKHDISGHVGGMGESFWQDGTNIKHVIISPNARIDDKFEAGDPAIFLGQMERSIKNNAFRHLDQDFEFKLTHLFTNEQKPRAIFYTYQQYAAMAGAGAAVKVNASGTIDGVAVWNAKARSGKMLLGRNRSRVDAKQVLGTATLQLKGLAGTMAHLRAARLINSGGRESSGFETALQQDLPVKNGEVSLVLPDFATGDAYFVEVTVSGDVPSPKPPTPPATATASGNKSGAAR